VFSGFSFSEEEQELISIWGKKDNRIILAEKMFFTSSYNTSSGISPFANTAIEQLERWKHEDTIHSISNETRFVAPLAEEIAVLCGVKPEYLDNLSPRKFEEMIAALFRNHGFSVELRTATRDGGYDILAVSHTGLGKKTILIEVKHFAPNRPVGVGIVRSLYGVKCLNNSSKAMLVTSSYVTKYAHHEFLRVIPWELDFIERSRLLDWCKKYVSDVLDEFDEKATEQGPSSHKPY
jgi:restriction endonuclease Mrr